MVTFNLGLAAFRGAFYLRDYAQTGGCDSETTQVCAPVFVRSSSLRLGSPAAGFRGSCFFANQQISCCQCYDCQTIFSCQAIFGHLSVAVREQKYSMSRAEDRVLRDNFGARSSPACKVSARKGCEVTRAAVHSKLLCVAGDWVQIAWFTWHGMALFPDSLWAFCWCAPAAFSAVARLKESFMGGL